MRMPVLFCWTSDLKVYHCLRKVANYPSLSDTGGNTDVVTRKVLAAFLSLIDDLRQKDTRVEEGLMLTDGASALRAVVADVPALRQQAAHLEIMATKTANPPPSSTNTCRARAVTTTPATRRRSGSKRAAPAGDSGVAPAETPRKKRARKRWSAPPRQLESVEDSSVAPSNDDGEPSTNDGFPAFGTPPVDGTVTGGAVGDDGGRESNEEETSDAHDVDDMLEQLRARRRRLHINGCEGSAVVHV